MHNIHLWWRIIFIILIMKKKTTFDLTTDALLAILYLVLVCIQSDFNKIFAFHSKHVMISISSISL